MSHDDLWQLDLIDAKLGPLLMLTEGRCIFGIIKSPEAAWPAIHAHLTALARDEGVHSDQMVVVDFDGGEPSQREALALNAARTSVLADLRLLAFLAPDAERMRTLLRCTPDLNTLPDFQIEVNACPLELPWDEVVAQIAALMRAQHQHLDLFGLLPHDPDHHSLPLDELYLPLVDFESTHGRQELFHMRQELSRYGDHLTDDVPPLPLPPPPRAWLILGNPGAGKTTALRHMALMAALGTPAPALPPHRTAILLPLSEWADLEARDRLTDLPTFLLSWLQERGVSGAHTILAHLDETALLLDGLDEVRSTSFRRYVLAEVQRLLERGLGCVLITTRPYVLDPPRLHPLLDTVETTQLRDPTVAEIDRFVHTFGAARARPASALRALTDEIVRHPTLRALASTPLILAFLCVLDEITGRLPEHRVEIYHRLGELLVERWRIARRLAGERNEPRLSRGDILRVLGPLACWLLERGGAPVPDDALLHTIARIELARNEAPDVATDRARRLLDILKADTALLQRSPDGRWSFLHLSLVEYFAATATANDDARWSALLADPFDPERRELLLLLAGYLALIEGRVQRLDTLCDAILRHAHRPGPYPAAYPLLLIDLLHDLSAQLATHHQTALLDRLFELVLVEDLHEDAINDTQHALIDLIRFATATDLRAPMRAALQRWLAPPREEIRWDRVGRMATEVSVGQHRWEATGGSREPYWFLLEAYSNSTISDALWSLHGEVPFATISAGLLLDALPDLLRDVDVATELEAHIEGVIAEHRPHVHQTLHKLVDAALDWIETYDLPR